MFYDFSEEFLRTKDKSYINLNNGTLGLCPDVVIEQQITELFEVEKNTSKALEKSWVRIFKIQEALAHFFKARSQDLFLRPNVTLVLNEIIMGLKIPSGSEILTTSFEYGAVVNILKLKARKENLKLRYFSTDFLFQDLTEDAIVEHILKEVRTETKVLLVSHVFTGNGIHLPLKKLSQRLREKDIRLVVDGAHSAGLMNVDFQDELASVDYYGANLHKWFMGPKGTAFGWVHPDRQKDIEPQYASWSTEDTLSPSLKPFLDTHPWALKMLWCHSLSFPSYYALESALEFWHRHTADFIFKEIQKRMAYLESNLLSYGLRPLKSTQEFNALMLCYSQKDFSHLDPSGGVLLKTTPRLQVGLPRVPGYSTLRLSPHIHNTEDELKQAVLILKDLV